MAMPRESAFLPTIKCSSCGNQVEISMMGEHLCEGEPPVPEVPVPKSYGGFGSMPPQSQNLADKYGHMPSPVDIGAANQPYMRHGQLTPGSHSSESQGVSPLTPGARSFPGRLDDYSPRIANDEPTTPLASQARRPGGYGGFADQEPNYIAHSPEKQTGGPMTQRMNTVAPGPFGADRDNSANKSFPRRKESLVSRTNRLQDPPRPATANPAASAGFGGAVAPPPRMPRKDGYGGFGAPTRYGEVNPPGSPGSLNRSETFPKPSLPTEPPLRTPSAPGSRPSMHRSRPSMGPDTSRPPPPRTSLMPAVSRVKKASVDLAAEFGIGNPYHTPSDSASSGYSGFSSRVSQSSFQTSPARSQPQRKPSDVGHLDDLMTDLETSMEGLGRQPLRIDSSVAPAPTRRSPAATSPYSTSPRDLMSGPSPRIGDVSPLVADRLAPSPRFASSPQQDMNAFGPRAGTSPSSPGAAPPSRKGSRDPGAPRGDCKACNLPITGKSISSADGRLTGKYHKACFVCTTCYEPFSSAEFYVLQDKPYCERHYHKLNGSLCGACSQGIEGQYLEDEEKTKYHVGCFRCLDCGRSLSDGYFDIDGRSYCEPDAMRRMQRYEAAEAAYAPRSRAGSGPAPRPVKGLPTRPGPGPRGPPGMGRPPFGAPPGSRLAPMMGKGPRPQMNKRMTRLGMM